MRVIIAVVAAVLPWRAKRLVYRRLLGYRVSESAFVGCSLLLSKHVALGPHCRIGNLNVLRGCRVVLDESAVIGNLNWITGFPEDDRTAFPYHSERDPLFHLGAHAAVTSRHVIECSDAVRIEEFASVGGYRSQVLTHSPDLEQSQLYCAPVTIGRFSFVGTGVTILPGAVLPAYSLLGAGSVLRSPHADEYSLYSGVPAVRVRAVDRRHAYFERSVGWIQ